MSSLFEQAQQLPQIMHGVVRFTKFIKARRREGIPIGLAVLLFKVAYSFSEWVPSELREFLKPWHVVLIAQGLCWVAGLMLLAYGVVRIWQLVHVPDLPPLQDRPAAVKGPMAFTEEDNALFWKLGRAQELQKLLGLILDPQVRMVILMGASGVGKTSLLRAGLAHTLTKRNVHYHYWEAVPTDSGARLLRAIQETWQEQAPSGVDGVAYHPPASIPTTLDALVNPSSELCRHQNHVIVLDQLEQLHGDNAVFQLLCQIARDARPPHRLTWIVAFRRDFRADWSDIILPEQEHGFFPPEVSLHLFTAPQAQAVIGQLIQDAQLSVEHDVVKNLIEAATVDGAISPVDIGIGMMVLAERCEQQAGQTVTSRGYQFAGGAEGLLTDYVRHCLDHFPKTEREMTLQAMLTLRDPAAGQRIAEGLSLEQIAQQIGTEPKRLKSVLDRLAQRDMRLLEVVTLPENPAARYRLPHERLIAALHRLQGVVLAEVAQAQLQFEKAFLAWRNNDQRAQYLLKSNELRLIARYTEQIPWGSDAPEKRTFLYRSKWRRNVMRAIAIAAVGGVIGMIGVGSVQYQRFQQSSFLRESGYPGALYDWQHQLKHLTLVKPFDLARFTWLSSKSVEELEIRAVAWSHSLAGLTSLSRCRSLKKLTLRLSGSAVSTLEPLAKLTELSQLTLDLHDTAVSTLEPLAKLTGLRQLTLTLSSTVNTLEPLAKLTGLRQLTLRLSGSAVSTLEPLAKLTELSQLTLEISGSAASTSEPTISTLEPLAKLTGLRQLTLRLSGRAVSTLESLAQLPGLNQLTLELYRSAISTLEPLAQLIGLRQLTLYHSNTTISTLEPLAKLTGLRQLTLTLDAGAVSTLEPLAQLPGLNQLTLKLRHSAISTLEPLAQLPDLRQLTLELGRSAISTLEPLAQLPGLRQLTLDLHDTTISTLEPLAQLTGLSQLTLYLNDTTVSSLEPLAQLTGLSQLTLYLHGTAASPLEPLAKLTSLRQLTLSLRPRAASPLEPLTQLTGLSQLTLYLNDTTVSSLEPLTQLTGLSQLTLSFSPSAGSMLESLAKLRRLQTLSIKQAANFQRMALQKIPEGLIHLTF